MKRYLGLYLVLALTLIALFSACGGSSHPLAVTLPAGQSATVTTAANESPVTLTASIANDSTGTATLDWSITGTVTGTAVGARPQLRNGALVVAPRTTTSTCGSLANATGLSNIFTPPTGVGNCTATVTACVSTNTSVCTTFTITVKGPLTNGTLSLNSGTYGTAYGPVTLSATGGVPSYTWSATGLPPGLTLTAAGVLSGTPSAAGSFNPAFKITDANSYATTPVTIPFTVAKAPLTVAASNASMTYGGTVPALNAAYTGFVLGDTAATALTGATGLTTTASSASAAGTYPITFGAGNTLAAANYSLTGFTQGTMTVNKATVTPVFVIATKQYDGTTAASINSASLTGVLGSDVVTVSGATAVFTSANIGAAVPVTVTGYSLGGAAGANYQLSSTTATSSGTITAKAVSVTVAAANKTYNANVTATLSSCLVFGTLPAEAGNVTCSAASAGFAQQNVGTGITVTANNITLGGSGAGNYSLSPNTATTTANITAATVTPGVTVSSKVYDTTATGTIATRTLTGVLGSDTVALSGGTATFASANVGTGIAVSVSGLSLINNAAGNYVLSSTTATTTANITPASVTAVFAINNKTYDGTTAAPIVAEFPSPVLGNDVVTVTGGTAVFAQANAGTGISVTITGFTLGGANAANYQLSSHTATSSANIMPMIVGAGVTANNKVYDATSTATLSSCVVAGVLPADTANVQCAAASASFAQSSVGNGIPVTASSITLSGLAAGNYLLGSTSATTMANITAASLTPGITATSKNYDTTTTASVTCSLTGVFSGDTVTCTAGAANFNTAAVGTGKTVTATSITLGGASSGNYQLTTTTATTTANINTASLTINGIFILNKTYDRTTGATIAGTPALQGVKSGDTVTLGGTGAATFASAIVGTGIGVTVTGYTISGASATNYTLTQPTGLTANINALILSVTGISASAKTYNGSTNATINATGAALSGVITGDTVTLGGSAVGTFSDANVANNKTVNISGLTLGGASAGNYALPTPQASAIASISALVITPSLGAANKVYDGTTAELTYSCTVASVILSVDAGKVTCSATGASFTDPNAGSNKTVTITGMSLSGASAGNYALSSTSGQLTTVPIQQATPVFSGLIYPTIFQGTTSATFSGTISLGSLIPTGTVAVSGGGGNIAANGAISSSNGSFTAMAQTGSLGQGTYPVVYQYGGDNNFIAINSTPGVLTVNPPINLSFSVSSPLNVVVNTSKQFNLNISNDPSTGGGAVISISGCGAISPLTASAGTQLTYTAPSTGVPCQATVTAKSNADPTKVATLNVFAYPALALPLGPTPSTLPTGTAGLSYSGTIMASGGVGPYHWSTTGLPSNGLTSDAGANTTSTLNIIGAAVPSAITTFSVSVTDSGNPQGSSGPVSYTVAVNAQLGVSLSPAGPVTLLTNSNQKVTLTIVGDSGNLGATYSMTPTPASGCGTFTGVGAGARQTSAVDTYYAPSVVTTACSVKITATTVATPSQTASLVINVNPPLLLQAPSSTTPGPGTVGQPYNGSINVVGGIPPYNWNLAPGSGETGLLDGIMSNASSITNTGATTLSLSTGGGTLTTPQTMTFTVAVQDSTGATTQQTQHYSITVSPAVPLTMPSNQISTNLVIGLPYGANFSAIGGVPPYTWSLDAGTGPLPAGLQLVPSGGAAAIVGIPTSANAGPFPMKFPVMVVVTDSAQKTASQTVSLTLDAAPDGSRNGYLYGHYAFHFRGVVDGNANGGSNSSYQTAAVGSFYADGNGTITALVSGTSPGGVVDVVDASAANNGFCPRTPFSGTYTIGADNRGIMEIKATDVGGSPNCTRYQWLTSNLPNTNNSTIPAGQSNYFVFSVGNIESVSLSSGTCTSPYPGASNTSCPLYIEGSLVEADDVGLWGVTGVIAPSYVTGSGKLYRQSYGQFNDTTTPPANASSGSNFAANFPGTYAMGLYGEDLAPTFGPVTAGGIVTFGPSSGVGSGSLNTNYVGGVSGSLDVNDNGSATTNAAIGAVLTPNTSNCTGTGYTPTWHTTGTDAGFTTSNGRWSANCIGVTGIAGYPTDYVGYFVDKNHSLFISSNPHRTSGNALLLSGDLYKQASGDVGNYTLSMLDGQFVAYTGNSDEVDILRLSCSAGNCTATASSQVKNKVYTQDFIKAVMASGRLPTPTVLASGRADFGPLGLTLYIYGSTTTGGRHGIMVDNWSGDSPKLGFILPQGTIPAAVAATTPESYFMGNFDYSTASNGNDANTGLITIDTTGAITLLQDTGRHGGTSWGSYQTGMTAGTVDPTSGFFDVLSGSTPQVRCYIVNPLLDTTTMPVQTNSPQYGLSVCMDSNNSNGPSNHLTIMRQVQ